MRVPPFIALVLVSLLAATLSLGTALQQGSATPKPALPHLTSLPASVLEAELKSARGSSFRLSDYSGKVLVINLWATWLGPSRMEIPELVKLQAHFWSQGVRVVGLSTENAEASAKPVHEWIRHFRVQYKIGWVPEDLAHILMQERDVVPQTYVVSPAGRIVKRFVGFNPNTTPVQFKEAIEEALREKSAVSHVVALTR